MIGRRVYPNTEDGNYRGLAAGDYGKWKDQWLVCVPTGSIGRIDSKWSVTEHEDGTITVSPSIEVSTKHVPELYWHGFLKKGVWESCTT